ncbi:MAG: ethylbenzene dehydrogenase-related protein, partial [Thaumarchaeota archaeon]|nr:ethylbenzene dehydrogenase-related protein [Nitrososphaerota archaeon]
MRRSKRVSRPKTLILTLAILLAAATLFASIHFTVVAQTNLPNIVSYKVQGAVDFKNPGGESFWRGIPWTAVPLAASVSPGGGHTSELLVKSANTGYDAYLLFKWNDTAGPSFVGQTEVYQATNGSLIPLNPQATATVKQLFYNSSYYYPDRLAVLWFVGSGSSRQTSPVMQLGTNGALTGGAADIWHWQSNPTDNNKNDAGFPGGYTNSAGKPIYPQDNLSFAEDDYTNMTGF